MLEYNLMQFDASTMLSDVCMKRINEAKVMHSEL